jgi:hypothetical protein
MAVDMKKMRKKRSEQASKGEFWAPPEGDTKLFIHPQSRPDDKWEPTEGLPYITVGVHYGIGKNNLMAVCLDADRNPIVKHPFVKEAMKARTDKKPKIEPKKGCPVCNAIRNEELDDEAAGESRFQERHLWGLSPVAVIGDMDDDWRWLDTAKPKIYLSGQTIHSELLDAFVENQGDITDPDSAVLVNLNRKGTKKFNTKYKAKVDAETARKPWQAPKALKRALAEFLKAGGEGDLFRVVANMIKGTGDLEAALSGVKVDEEDDAGGDEDAKPKACFGTGDITDDEECRDCKFKVKCAAVTGDPVPGGGDDSDDDEEEEKPKKKKKSKKKAEPEPEPEEDEDEDEDEDDLPGDLGQDGKGPTPDDDDEDDDEDASTDEDDDDDSDDDDDDEDEELAALELKLAKAKAAKAKKKKAEAAKAKGKAKPKKKKAAPVDDDDDDGLDKLDAELAAMSKGKK